VGGPDVETARGKSFAQSKHSQSSADPPNQRERTQLRTRRPEHGDRPENQSASQRNKKPQADPPPGQRPKEPFRRHRPQSGPHPPKTVRSSQSGVAGSGERSDQHECGDEGRSTRQRQNEFQRAEKKPCQQGNDEKQFEHASTKMARRARQASACPPTAAEMHSYGTMETAARSGTSPCMACQRARNSATSRGAAAGSLSPKTCAL